MNGPNRDELRLHHEMVHYVSCYFYRDIRYYYDACHYHVDHLWQCLEHYFVIEYCYCLVYYIRHLKRF